MIEIKFSKTKLEKIQKAASDARAKLQNASGAYKRIAVYLDSWVQQNFRGQGSKVGNWAPLKKSGRPLPNGGFDQTAMILQDTGMLRASVQPFATNRNAGIGSELDYSKKHDEGLGNVPQRRILPRETDDDVNKVAADILDKFAKESVVDRFMEAFK